VESAEAPRWSGRMRGGRFGNLFFATLARGRLSFLIPFFLFWVALYYLAAAPAARRSSFDLADRTGRGGSFLRRLRFAFAHFYAFGTLLIERVAILSGNIRSFRFRSTGEEHIVQALDEGRGAILLTAHLGSWEVMGHFLGEFGAEVTLVMADVVQPEMRETAEDLAAGRSFRVLRTDGSPESAAAILEILSRGGVVGMMGDRVIGDRGIEVPFLGGTALFPTGPFALAAAGGAPLLPVFAFRTGRRSYAFRGHPPVRLGREPSRERHARVRELAEGFAANLEEHLRAHPEQWGNFFAFWKLT